jgi:excisionase family DNA binding protein
MTKQEYYTVAEVAVQLRVSADTVMRLLRAEKLQGEKVGKQWRISDYAVQEYLKTSKKKG